MKRILSFIMLFAFVFSPAALGSNVSPADIYKKTYIELMQGVEKTTVLKNFVGQLGAHGVTVQEVLDAAVKDGFISSGQAGEALKISQNNMHLFADSGFAERARNGQITEGELAGLMKVLQSQVTGASYHYDLIDFFFVLLILAVCLAVVSHAVHH
ncbi:MAG: hypothetical protein AB1540_16610 [Bdellovibrionota bacterium]